MNRPDAMAEPHGKLRRRRNMKAVTQVLTPLSALALCVALVACGDQTAATSPSQQARAATGELPRSIPLPEGEVATLGPVTVLDDGNGAELCLGGVAESLPPQCGGPPIVGWDWADHDGDYEDVRGVRWGDFVVIGIFDGSTVTPNHVVPADEYDAPPTKEAPHETTCRQPTRGWVVDPGRTGMADYEAAIRAAHRLDGFAGSFVDTSRDPRSPEQMDQDFSDGVDDASSWIVNVAVTRDPVAAEAAIREVWGGGVCVTTSKVTERELLGVQRAIHEADVPGFLSSGVDDDAVHLEVVHDDGSIQAWADEEFGDRLVRVWSALAAHSHA